MDYSCIILNFMLLILLAFEMYRDYDIILDNAQSTRIRKKYAIRLIISCIVIGLALMWLYRLFGVNGANLFHYVEYGTVR